MLDRRAVGGSEREFDCRHVVDFVCAVEEPTLHAQLGSEQLLRVSSVFSSRWWNEHVRVGCMSRTAGSRARSFEGLPAATRHHRS